MNYVDQLGEDIYFMAHGNRAIDAIDRPLYRLYALLGLVKGDEVTREDVHDAWSVWIVGRPDYDPARPPQPGGRLTAEAREKDQPYANAINLVMRRREREN